MYRYYENTLCVYITYSIVVKIHIPMSCMYVYVLTIISFTLPVKTTN